MSSIWTIRQNNTLRVVGLMSGTSMDGLDICLAEISRKDNEITVKVIAFSEYSYPSEFKNQLKQIPFGDTRTVCRMNMVIGTEYASLIRRFLQEHNISVEEIDLIGSHGQTVWHEHRHSTLQIGEASVLTETFGVPVISDFRVRDVAAGGSGAPLVPFVDFLLFKRLRKNLMVLNIGGIANFTLIPKDAKNNNDIFALDTGPGNSLIDLMAELYSDGAQAFDKDGEIARSGQIREDILKYLMEHPYIRSAMPKSTGREEFGKNIIDDVLLKYNLKRFDSPDLTATLTRFTAEAIYSNYQQFFAYNYPIDEIIISGGGADNPVLMKHLEELFEGVAIKKSDEYGFSGDAKEALAFAVLAAATAWEIPANVPNVTGARHPVILGKISQ